jgi:hypothetical protein
MSELCLDLRVCRNPAGMMYCGDTCQVNGVALCSVSAQCPARAPSPPPPHHHHHHPHTRADGMPCCAATCRGNRMRRPSRAAWASGLRRQGADVPRGARAGGEAALRVMACQSCCTRRDAPTFVCVCVCVCVSVCAPQHHGQRRHAEGFAGPPVGPPEMQVLTTNYRCGCLTASASDCTQRSRCRLVCAPPCPPACPAPV